MKKTLLTLAATALLTCSLAICASAEKDATTNLDIVNANSSGIFSVEHTIELDAGETANNGDMYGMIAVLYSDAVADGATTATLPTITEDSIYYIDQADVADGKITFANFAPKGASADGEDADWKKCIVFVGGPAYDTAQAICVLDAYVPPAAGSSATITGTVTDTIAGTKEATVTVMDGDTKIGETTTVNGAYTVELDATDSSTVSVVFTKLSFLKLTYNDVPVASDTTLNVNMSELAGDVTGDGTVLMPDINYVSSKFRGDDALADVNGDGTVLMPDINATSKNFRDSDAVYTYSAN